MWVGGCATALAAWASGPSALASRGPWGRRRRGTSGPARSRVRLWGRRSVHRSAEMASRRRFGAFVYTVVTVGLGCGWPWDRNSVHKWEDRASPRRFRAFVYTVATRVAIRIATRVAPGGTSAPTAMACRRHPSRWAPLPWSGRQTLREWRRREVGVFAEASTHTNPRGANSWASFPTIVLS